MKPSRLWITVFILLMLFSYSHSDTVVAKQPSHSQPFDGEAEILESWQGDYPVAQLKLLPEVQRDQAVGYIGDAKTFESVWKAFKPGENVPEIDFKANLVLFARNIQFYNRISIGKVNVTNGVAEVLAMETRSAIPIQDKVAISLVVVPSKAVRSIRTADGLVVISDDDKISKPLRPKGQTAAQTYAYDCSDGYSFIARIEGEKAWLFLPNQTLSLLHVPSGSGAKYREGVVMFWNKGDEAVLEVGKERHVHCKNNRVKVIWEDAKLRGVDFRAVGNEPGWQLELTAGEKIVLVGDYGTTRQEFATPEPIIDQNTRSTTYRIQEGKHDLVILIQGQGCHDSMSGNSFETTVTVVLDGKEYRGCGKALH